MHRFVARRQNLKIDAIVRRQIPGFGGVRTRAVFVHWRTMETDPNFALARTMDAAPRITASPPPCATRAEVQAHARMPVRGLASALLGALLGLAAGAAFVAGAPVVGRTIAAGDAPAVVRDAGAGPARGEAASAVSSVLAPAIDAGVVSAPDAEAARP